jgi:hypothetical protein
MQAGKLFLFAFVILMTACNSGTGTVVESDTITVNDTATTIPPAPPNKKDTTIGGCYAQIFKRDTSLLQLDITGNNATGPLTYKIYEKDMNDGSIKAELSDSIIMGWYIFRSEGMMSVRQVAWKVKPGQLWPAVGEIIQRNDSTVYKNPSQLKFDASRPFLKVPCSL